MNERQGPVEITPPGEAPANANVVAAKQADDQLDAFFVGNDGSVKVTWERADQWWTDGVVHQPGPTSITPLKFAPPGAPLAVAEQAGKQLDVFVVGSDGSLYVTWTAGLAAWTGTPARITAPNFSSAGASVAAAQQGENQLDAFVVNKDSGDVFVFFVQGANAAWSEGSRITSGIPVPANASLAAAQQSPNQLDVFFVGADGAVYVTWVANNGAWSDGLPGHQRPKPLTPQGFAPPGACITVARQNDQLLDLFIVDKQQQLANVIAVVGQSNGSDGTPSALPPAPIVSATGPFTALPGTCVGAIKRDANQMVAVVTGVKGAPWLTWENSDGRWRDGVTPFTDPAQLSQAVWMRGCWPCWPHIHGAPVYARFASGREMIYVWPEKDYLKSYPWVLDHVDTSRMTLGVGKDGSLAIAPFGPPNGMPGGMLAASVDPTGSDSGVLFASIPRSEGDQSKGVLRAFDPITLRELWNNVDADYLFSKFTPPTIAGGKVFLPTGKDAKTGGSIIVYGLK